MLGTLGIGDEPVNSRSPSSRVMIDDTCLMSSGILCIMSFVVPFCLIASLICVTHQEGQCSDDMLMRNTPGNDLRLSLISPSGTTLVGGG